MTCSKCGYKSEYRFQVCPSCSFDMLEGVYRDPRKESELIVNTGGKSMAYKVKVVDIGCCESDINPQAIENISNEMDKHGYYLLQVYIDTTSSCCGSKKSLIMIFNNSKK